MPTNICEFLRKVSVESCFTLSAFVTGWSTWQTEFNRLIGSIPTVNNILNIGDNLSEVFKTTGTAGRAQNEVSGGGYAWEGLICWYLNLCLAGTRAVVLRKASDSPQP